MIDILLSTHNGARFLSEQLGSLSRQTVSDWKLWVRDDASEDGTHTLLRRYQLENPMQVSLTEGEEQRGAAQSFGWLLAQSTAPYVMFCDQDDVWLPDKIARTLAEMKTLEKLHGAHTPLLVHTDMQVVNKELDPRHDSFAQAMKLHPKRVPLPRLLTQNVATGCTMMINRSLAERVGTIPPQARMHDMWIALVAAIFGHIAWLPAATMLYRQHSYNQIGVRDLRRLPGRVSLGMILTRNAEQAAALLAAHGSTMPGDNRAAVARFMTLSAQRYAGWRLWRAGYRRLPWYQNLPFMALSK